MSQVHDILEDGARIVRPLEKLSMLIPFISQFASFSSGSHRLDMPKKRVVPTRICMRPPSFVPMFRALIDGIPP